MSDAPSDRRWTLALIALAVVAPIGALVLPFLAPSRSNMPVVPRTLCTPVVIVTAGGMQAARVGHLGGPDGVTPHLDRLAEIGVSVTHAYADANFEAGTTASLLTGQCSKVHGVRRPDDTLDPDVPTLAGHFRAAGWKTLAVVGNTANVGRGFERDFDVFDALTDADAHEVVAHALERVAEAEVDNPRWLLWIDLGDLVPPYGRSPDVDATTRDPDVPADFGTTLDDYGVTLAEMARRGWDRTQAGWLGARYEAALSDVDAALGELVDALEAEHWFETGYLFVVGTCGTRIDERPGLVGAHAVDLHQHSLRVPLVAHLPSRFVRGLQIARFAHPSDVAPTLLDLVLRRTPTLRGESLRGVFVFQHRVHDAAVSEGWVRPGDGAPWRGLAITHRNGKLIADEDLTRGEHYNLATDPSELAPQRLSGMQLDVVVELADPWRETCR